jgi:hypothetical protein
MCPVHLRGQLSARKTHQVPSLLCLHLGLPASKNDEQQVSTDEKFSSSSSILLWQREQTKTNARIESAIHSNKVTSKAMPACHSGCIVSRVSCGGSTAALVKKCYCPQCTGLEGEARSSVTHLSKIGWEPWSPDREPLNVGIRGKKSPPTLS